MNQCYVLFSQLNRIALQVTDGSPLVSQLYSDYVDEQTKLEICRTRISLACFQCILFHFCLIPSFMVQFKSSHKILTDFRMLLNPPRRLHFQKQHCVCSNPLCGIIEFTFTVHTSHTDNVVKTMLIIIVFNVDNRQILLSNAKSNFIIRFSRNM